MRIHSSNVSNQVNSRRGRGREGRVKRRGNDTHTLSFTQTSHFLPSLLSGKEAERDIEEHFAKCMNALAERKSVLLGEAALKVTNQSMI